MDADTMQAVLTHAAQISELFERVIALEKENKSFRKKIDDMRRLQLQSQPQEEFLGGD